MADGRVVGVSRNSAHAISKQPVDCIRLVAGIGVEDDAHAGVTVQHRSRVARDPTQPNLRQVHLIHEELYEALEAAGFDLSCGTLGENVTTRGVELLALPVGTRLHVGTTVVVELTGLRNPCAQLDGLRPGLMAAVLGRGVDGERIPKCGVMGIVIASGDVRPGDPIHLRRPPPPGRRLERV